MSPERDEHVDEQDQELYEDVPPRSIFAATWFRVVLVVIVLGVIGAVAVPYVLDWMNPPPPARSASATRTPMVPAAGTSSAAMPADQSAGDKSPASGTSSSAMSAGSDKPAADRSADKKDSATTLPAPMPPTSMAARTETPTENKPAAKADTKAAPKLTAEAKSKSAPADSEAKTTVSTAKPSATKPGAAPKSAVAKSDTSAAIATKPSSTRQASVKATTPASSAVGGPYWVQVGAFKDAEAARRLAAKLRDENFKVEESVKPMAGGARPAPAAAPKAAAATPAPGSDQYDVLVSGMSAEELNRRLAGKGLSAETSGNGVVVKPSLPLRDAVALSKDLAVEGFKVQVRRSSASAPAPAPPAATAALDSGTALHRVRVGAFTDRTAAVAAARELEAKGYKPYIARGDQ